MPLDLKAEADLALKNAIIEMDDAHQDFRKAEKRLLLSIGSHRMAVTAVWNESHPEDIR